MPGSRRGRGPCSGCGTERSLTSDGVIVKHLARGNARHCCPGSGFPPGNADDWKSRALRAEALLTRVQYVCRRTRLGCGTAVNLVDVEAAMQPPRYEPGVSK